ncbi:MAG: hypothetical protein ABIZ70_05075 [Gemmatimonadales bacterium]
MRTTTLSLIAATLLALPLVAQDAPRPQPAPRRAAEAATTADKGSDRLSEAQRDRLDAIRTRYSKEARTARDASRARRDKMRDEVRGVLTPAQRERLDHRREMMRNERPGIRARMAQSRGMRGGRMAGGMRGAAAMRMRGRMGAGMGRNERMRGRMGMGAGMGEGVRGRMAPGAAAGRGAMMPMPRRAGGAGMGGAPVAPDRPAMRRTRPAPPAAPARPEGEN